MSCPFPSPCWAIISPGAESCPMPAWCGQFLSQFSWGYFLGYRNSVPERTLGESVGWGAVWMPLSRQISAPRFPGIRTREMDKGVRGAGAKRRRSTTARASATSVPSTSEGRAAQPRAIRLSPKCSWVWMLMCGSGRSGTSCHSRQMIYQEGKKVRPGIWPKPAKTPVVRTVVRRDNGPSPVTG